MYWEKPGKQNTDKTVEIVKDAVKEKGIRYIVFPSSRGYTAEKLLKADLGVNLVCVTHVCGFKSPGEMEFPQNLREQLEADGIKFFTGTHVLSGAERGVSNKFKGCYPAEIIANSLRMLGQGVKVCVEVAVMALDAGLIPYDENIIALGGSSEGVDTAVIMRPAHAANIFDSWISEILCKPSEKL
ncbi:MAG: hypothetical protein GX759_06640 [Thermoanaerobacterales bacterium]|jgi:hypothetical protein|nr:hypothetical protein [Thermoanaerobacterales bacterium]